MHRNHASGLWLGCLLTLGAVTDPAMAQNYPCGNNETVVYGDTLYEIAQRCNTTVETILRLNPEIGNPNNISVGTTLAMPTAGATPAPEEPRDTGPTPEDWQVVVTPRSGPPGSAVTVRASGFPPGERVLIGRGPHASEYELQRHAEADHQGRVRVDSQIPPYAEPGDRWVFVAKAPGSREEAVSGTFRVVAASSPPADDDDDEDTGQITVSGRITGEGVECPTMRARNGKTYSLTGADFGDYEEGDRITVTGSEVGISFCQQGITLQVAELSGSPDDDEDDSFGELQRVIGTLTGEGVECPALRARDGTLYTLTGDGVDSLREGQRVYVEGRVAEVSFCQQGITLAVQTLDRRGQGSAPGTDNPPAAPDDREIREVTGVITDQGAECPALRGDDGTLYTLTGNNLGRLQPGQRVFVVGRVAKVSFCQQGTTLAVNVVEVRGREGFIPGVPGTRPDQTREVSGVITDQGVECPALRGDDGTLYTLTGNRVDSLRPGQQVTVAGSVAEISFCQQGITLAVDRLEVQGRRN